MDNNESSSNRLEIKERKIYYRTALNVGKREVLEIRQSAEPIRLLVPLMMPKEKGGTHEDHGIDDQTAPI